MRIKRKKRLVISSNKVKRVKIELKIKRKDEENQIMDYKTQRKVRLLVENTNNKNN